VGVKSPHWERELGIQVRNESQESKSGVGVESPNHEQESQDFHAN
jgi:hypothetical protein